MHSSRPQIELTAYCACGAIALSVAGEVKSMLLCACADCQRETGTGHSAVFSVAAESLAIKGAPTSFSRPADSGAIFTRFFCPACGTPLYGISSRAPTLALVPVGLFGAAAATWFRPSQLIFARSRRDWDPVVAELPQHATYRQRDGS